MAIRKPLVIVAGQVQQLQAADTLDVNSESMNLTNDEAGAVVIGSAVYADANDGFKKAQANGATASKCIGLVGQTPSITNGVAGTIKLSGVLTATTVQWDAVAGTTGGLAVNTDYWLDPATAGSITATAPSTVGQYVVKIGRALSTTEMKVGISNNPILL